MLRISIYEKRSIQLEEWNCVININLLGIFLSAKEAVRIMSQQKSGKIINTAPQLGFCRKFPLLMVLPYHAVKGGLISVTKQVALEHAKNGINLNATCIKKTRNYILDRLNYTLFAKSNFHTNQITALY
jgi:NAD(P)-dependent dehydrogenase (short-subunit alcohol dehydrogenase family)